MTESSLPRHLILTGLSGAGKSAVGALLAQRIGWPFVDLDLSIARRRGLSIGAIFERLGEREFRRLECVALRRALQSRRRTVIALGGGALLSATNRSLVRRFGYLVYLQVSCAEAARRLARAHDRPLTLGTEGERLSHHRLVARLRDLLRLRLRGFAAADYRINVSRLSAAQVAYRIAVALRAREIAN
ncbi:MAG TPA: shikimate kinase [candidate division Zixibacteria bacterium]|nr:shikimate kinase [candidate division Zixibacteria bacterium]